MITQTTYDLLKQLPRHGLSPEEEGAREVVNILKAFKDFMPGFKDAADSFIKSVNAMDSAQTNMSQGLGKIVGLQESLTNKLLPTIKNITFLENQNSKLNKSFKLSSANAQNFATKLRAVAIEVKVGSGKLMDYAENLKGVTAGFINSSKMSGVFQKSLLKGQLYMINNLQTTEEAAAGYERYSFGLQKTSEDQLTAQAKLAEVLGKTTGIDALTIQADLTEEIGNMTADLQLRYSKIPGSLELAILKSKALGTSMSQLNATGKGLLDIESAIGAEQELQLLTGKRILTQNGKSLTDEYRKATVMRDSAKQAELMSEFIDLYGGDLENNMLAMEAATKLFSSTEADLSSMIQISKQKGKLNKTELLGDATKNSAGLSATSLNARAANASADLMKQTTRTTAEQAGDKIESDKDKIIAELEAKGALKVGEVSTQVLSGLNTILDEYSKITAGLRETTSVTAIGKITRMSETIADMKAPFDTLVSAIPELGTDIKALTDKFAKFLSINLPTGGSVKVTSEQQDALLMNDGLIKFNPADKFMQVNDSTMIAGTNVDGNKKLARAIQGGTSIDYNRLASAIAAAISNIKVEAKVTTDTLLSATKMNGSRMS